jgi:nitrogen regulatory protein P-II 1
VKEIKAYIRPQRFEPTAFALHKIEGLTGLSVSEVRGMGRGFVHYHDPETGEINELLPQVKLEVVCREELVEEVLRTIRDAAYTGVSGDGKVFVLDVVDALRIRTEERGEVGL